MIIQKIEALFPVLEDMAGKNDGKSTHIIGKLVNLKESLDEAFREMENEIDLNGNENNDLKNRLRRAEGQSKTVYTEDTEGIRRLEK